MKKLLFILMSTISFTGICRGNITSPSKNILGEYTLLSQSGSLSHFCGYTAELKFNKNNQQYIFSQDSGSYSFFTKATNKIEFNGDDIALNDGRFDGENEMWHEADGAILKKYWNQTKFKFFKRNEVTTLDLTNLDKGEVRFSRSANVTFEFDSNFEFDCVYSKN